MGLVSEPELEEEQDNETDTTIETQNVIAGDEGENPMVDQLF